MSAWSEARYAGREAGRRAVGQRDESEEPFRRYLRELKEEAEKAGNTVGNGVCMWCGNKAWKTGVLPEIYYPMAYCRNHKSAYDKLRNRPPDAEAEAERNRARARTHFKDPAPLGGTFCGIMPRDENPKLTTNWRLVDCQRCLEKRR